MVVFEGSVLLPVLVTTGSDGILISGKNEKEHLEDLRQVLCIIQENGLHIRLDFRKYVFFKAKFSKQNFYQSWLVQIDKKILYFTLAKIGKTFATGTVYW